MRSFYLLYSIACFLEIGTWSRALGAAGFRGFKGFKRFRGEGIAFGDEYIVSVKGLAFVSPVLHYEEQKPPSTGRNQQHF